MASFVGSFMAVSLTLMAFMVSPSPSLSSNKLKLETTITVAPALLPATTTATEISPDIAPLLPSSGIAAPSTGSSMPTIPSNPSQNPDEIPAFSPDSAVSPSGLLPDSSAVSLNLVRSLNLAVYMVLLSCWSVLVFAF